MSNYIRIRNRVLNTAKVLSVQKRRSIMHIWYPWVLEATVYGPTISGMVQSQHFGLMLEQETSQFKWKYKTQAGVDEDYGRVLAVCGNCTDETAPNLKLPRSATIDT